MTTPGSSDEKTSGLLPPEDESTPLGIPASQLSEEDLRRQLKNAHDTRHETLLNGSRAALETHTRRMLELEQEFLARFPTETAPDPQRTQED